jgi:hypothetical protein
MFLPLVEAIAWPGAGRSAASPWVVQGIALPVTALFTAWLLWSTRRLPTPAAPRRVGRVLPFRPRADRTRLVLLLVAALMLVPSLAGATPSTTYWAPSTANCQAFRVPHVTYDTYFGKGPAAGGPGAPNYPIDVGLTMGVLPAKKLQGELGFDLLLPSQVPLYVNAKLCTPESSLFDGSPAISAGIYNLGFTKGVTDYDVLYLMLQKSLPRGGYVGAGVYHGLSEALFTNSDGRLVRTGALLGFFSPDIPVGVKGLKKLNLTADVQTGKNVLGAGGAGVYVYFTDTISLLTGPIFFFDKALQPGGRRMLWTFQLDVDIPLGRK